MIDFFHYCFSEKLNQWWKLFTNENDHAKMLELDWMEILKSSIKHTFNEITFSIREGTWNEQSIHLWNWNFKSQLRWWKCLLNVKQHFKIKIQMAGRNIFEQLWTSLWISNEKNNLKNFIRFPFLQMEIEFTITKGK